MLKNAVPSATRAACCMLWVTMMMVYSSRARHQILDASGGDGVERRARLVHQHHLGFTAMARAMQSRCCWPPDRPSPAAELSFTSFHRAPRSERLDEVVHVVDLLVPLT